MIRSTQSIDYTKRVTGDQATVPVLTGTFVRIWYRLEDLSRLPQHTAVVILRPLLPVATVSVEIVLAVPKGNYSEFAIVLQRGDGSLVLGSPCCKIAVRNNSVV